MTNGEQAAGDQPGEPVGSVGEEAAKLFDALQGWVKDNGAGDAGRAGAAEGLVDGLADQWRSFHEHIATGGQDCTYCPVCQVIGKVREASPELRSHLAVATSSLLQAAATIIEARAPRPAQQEPWVTKIDLDVDADAEDRDVR